MHTLPAASKGHQHAGTRAIALLMGFAATTLAAMSSLHLSGTLSGGPEPFNRTHAGIAEALICVALSAGATMLFRRSPHARGAALASVAFAIFGFIVGLNFTIQGGDAIDIAYHATLLPLLLITLTVLWRGALARRQA
jgi:Na+/proline symporter